MNLRQEFEKLQRNPKNVRFNRVCALAETFGFRLRKGRGSHRVYIREGIRDLLNFQNVGGWAKPYQVRQFIKLIKKYNLLQEAQDEP